MTNKKTKEIIKLTCFQASNLLKLSDRKRDVAVKMFGDSIKPLSQWSKIFTENGLI